MSFSTQISLSGSNPGLKIPFQLQSMITATPNGSILNENGNPEPFATFRASITVQQRSTIPRHFIQTGEDDTVIASYGLIYSAFKALTAYKKNNSIWSIDKQNSFNHTMVQFPPPDSVKKFFRTDVSEVCPPGTGTVTLLFLIRFPSTEDFDETVKSLTPGTDLSNILARSDTVIQHHRFDTLQIHSIGSILFRHPVHTNFKKTAYAILGALTPRRSRQQTFPEEEHQPVPRFEVESRILPIPSIPGELGRSTTELSTALPESIVTVQIICETQHRAALKQLLGTGPLIPSIGEFVPHSIATTHPQRFIGVVTQHIEFLSCQVTFMIKGLHPSVLCAKVKNHPRTDLQTILSLFRTPYETNNAITLFDPVSDPGKPGQWMCAAPKKTYRKAVAHLINVIQFHCIHLPVFKYHKANTPGYQAGITYVSLSTTTETSPYTMPTSHDEWNSFSSSEDTSSLSITQRNLPPLINRPTIPQYYPIPQSEIAGIVAERSTGWESDVAGDASPHHHAPTTDWFQVDESLDEPSEYTQTGSNNERNSFSNQPDPSITHLTRPPARSTPHPPYHANTSITREPTRNTDTTTAFPIPTPQQRSVAPTPQPPSNTATTARTVNNQMHPSRAERMNNSDRRSLSPQQMRTVSFSFGNSPGTRIPINNRNQRPGHRPFHSDNRPMNQTNPYGRNRNSLTPPSGYGQQRPRSAQQPPLTTIAARPRNDTVSLLGPAGVSDSSTVTTLTTEVTALRLSVTEKDKLIAERDARIVALELSRPRITEPTDISNHPDFIQLKESTISLAEAARVQEGKAAELEAQLVQFKEENTSLQNQVSALRDSNDSMSTSLRREIETRERCEAQCRLLSRPNRSQPVPKKAASKVADPKVAAKPAKTRNTPALRKAATTRKKKGSDIPYVSKIPMAPPLVLTTATLPNSDQDTNVEPGVGEAMGDEPTRQSEPHSESYNVPPNDATAIIAAPIDLTITQASQIDTSPTYEPIRRSNRLSPATTDPVDPVTLFSSDDDEDSNDESQDDSNQPTIPTDNRKRRRT